VIPEDIVGQQIFFKATYVHETLGTLVNRIPEGYARNRLTVVAPCSQKDRDRALGSYVQYAFAGGKPERALALADSLIPLGWRDLAGLAAASIAAQDVGQLQRSLEYLDLNYSANGKTDFFNSSGSFEREAEKYQSIRQGILRKIEQQRQNQQH